jgi:hypothetical protein
MKKPVVWIALAFVALVGALMYTSLQGVTQHRVEACMSFNGRDNCRTARGESEADAKRTAIDNACADITNGMTEIVSCQNSEPKSLKVLTSN